MFLFTHKMSVQAHTIRAFHLFHLLVWSSGIFMVRSGFPQTTPQVTALLPLMRNKCRLTHDNSFSNHHPGSNWVFGAGVACNLTIKITSHQVWTNNHSSLSVGPVANATDVLQPVGLLHSPYTPRLFGHSHVRHQVPPGPQRCERS